MKHRELYLRRLHSLTGLLMGLFLFNHFLTNSFILNGRESFNHKVYFIHSIPFLLLVEIGMIFLPFAFHMFYGFYIMWTGKNNSLDYGYGRNWMYGLQRATAWILAPFIIYHLAEWRLWYNAIHLAHYDEAHNFILGAGFYDELVEHFSQPWYWAVYLVGVIAAIVHFANGLCTFCMTWGVTSDPKSQKRFIPVALGIGAVYAMLIGRSFWGIWLAVSQHHAAADKVAMAASQTTGIFF